MRKNILLTLLCIISLFAMVGCNLNDFLPDSNDNPQQEENNDNEQRTIYNLAVESGYKGTYEQWLDSIKGDSVVLQVSNGYIQWKYSEDLTWKNLISLTELAGQKGEPGKDGVDGESGKSAYETFKEYYPNYAGTEKDWITDVATGNTCNLFGHKWDEGEITLEPTKDVDGEKKYTCQTCNEHKYEVLPKIEVAAGEIYEENGIKYINYGSYPQTHVGAEELIAELNKLTKTNDRGYYEYDGKEYAKVTATSYQTGSYSDGSKIQKNTIEWFEVEPIKWRIISENTDGSYQLYSEYILGATSYCDYAYLRNIDGNDVYLNNYKYSNIRAWLNGYDGREYKVSDYTNKGFYNMAFKDNEKDAIITKEVDNSASTTYSLENLNACENTNDKMYLLSYKDMYNLNYGFTDNASRYAKVTDYAKATGAYWDTSVEYLNNGHYWLRSPDGNSEYASCVYGGSNDYNRYVGSTNYGVRVACTINLE